MRVIGILMLAIFVFSALAVAGEEVAPQANQAAAGAEGEQQVDKAAAEIPTLSEWGMIIFSVVLVGWMTWMIIRRKQKATVGM